MKRIAVVVVVCGMFTVGLGAASAADIGCGSVVATDVTLQADLIDCPWDGLVVGADGITIDLNGHTISGPGDVEVPDGALVPVGIENRGGFDGVTITGGTITGFHHGLLLVGASDGVIENVTVTGSVSRAVFLTAGSDRNVVTHNDIVDNLFSGLELFDADDNQITFNTVRNHPSAGIRLLDSNDRNVVHGNQATHNNEGIVLQFGSDDNRVTENLVARNTFAGINILASSLRNELVGNSIVSNWHGVLIQTDSAYITLRSNLAMENRLDGFDVNVTSGGFIDFIGNVAIRNGLDGFDINQLPARLTSNTADHNRDLGIEAIEGVTDGGGNSAEGNGNALQCEVVACSTG